MALSLLRAVPFRLALGVSLLLAASLLRAEDAPLRNEPFQPTLHTLDERVLRPFDKKQTKALVLVFTLPDCPIANGYLPKINRLHDEFSGKGISLVLVQADYTLTVDQARAHAREYQVKCPVVLDARHEWVERAKATRTPEVVVFGRSGDVLYRGRIDDRYAGLGKRRIEATTEDLHDALASIIAGKPVKQANTQAIGCFIPKRKSGD